MRVLFISALTCAIVSSASAVFAQPLLKYGAADGRANVTVGLLSQPTLDWEQVGDADGVGSAYVRRMRLIVAGQMTPKLKLFLDTDTPYLGREVGGARQRTTYLQDLVVTYAYRDELQFDGGLLIVPVAYNSTQSAASLLGIGYGAYTFASSAPTTSKVGRDQGAQARGYLLSKHLEYRVAAFRGIRQIDADAPLRRTMRVAWHAFDAQSGLFYAGTTHGKKRLLTVGASLDQQADYTAASADVFYEVPLRDRDAFTLQADAIRYDGGVTLRQLPRQDTLFVESGYTWGRRRLGVFAQTAWQDVKTGADAASWQVGGAWWVRGHRVNLKAGVGRVTRDGAPARTQLLVQSQVFAF